MLIRLALLAAVSVSLASCVSDKSEEVHVTKHASHFDGITRAVAEMLPTKGSGTVGWLVFDQTEAGVRVTADVWGLSPNATHAMHVHQFGDARSDDGKSAGGHYNPDGHAHGLPGTVARHAGDLGNLKADAAGYAHYEIVVANATVAGMMNPYLGRGVIIHAKADDGGQPTGNAGGRISYGVIGVANPAR